MSPAEFAARSQSHTREGTLYRDLLGLRERYGEVIERDFPKHWRRASGYNLPELLRQDEFNGGRLITSSEGTLAFGTEYTIGLVPVPTMTAMVILQFNDIVTSMDVVTTILECEPSAVELMDGMLIGLTRQQPAFARQIEFIKGNPQAVLTVEFYGENEAELRHKVDHLKAHLAHHGMTGDVEPLEIFDPRQQAGVWAVRKSGQGLLMSTRGDAKPIACIEDVSVPVEHLAEYVREVVKLVADHGTTAAFYAHASAGCLHVRPLVNMKNADGVKTMRSLTEHAAELAVKFGGVMSGEHSDGLARGELNERVFGSQIYQCMRELKAAFDPAGLMNPGKMVDCPSMTDNLRYGADYHAMPSHDTPELRPRRRLCRRCRNVQRRRRLPQSRNRDDVPLLHRDAGRARFDAWTRQRAARRARRTGTEPGSVHRQAHLRCSRSVPLLQGLQNRVPVERRHGQDQDRVPGPVLRRPWRSASHPRSSGTST